MELATAESPTWATSTLELLTMETETQGTPTLAMATLVSFPTPGLV